MVDGRRIFVNTGALIRIDDAESDHRCAGARDRPHRRRPPVAPARRTGASADSGADQHAARRGGDGRRRRIERAGQAGAAHDHRHPASRDALAALLSARARGAGRPRRREVPRPRPVNPRRACTKPSSASPTSRCSPRVTPILTRSRIRCRPSVSRRSPEIARTSPNWEKKDPPELQARHDMMRAKLSGFMEPPQTVARRYPLERHLASRALCACDLDLSPFRLCARPLLRSTR